MSRKTYKARLEFLFQMDDETLTEVKRQIEEHISMMYHKMERENIRISLQTRLNVLDLG